MGQKSFLCRKKIPGQKHPDPKVKNNSGHLSLSFHVEQPETLIKWKFKSITDGRTHLRWVGARDTRVSKKHTNLTVRLDSPLPRALLLGLCDF